MPSPPSAPLPPQPARRAGIAGRRRRRWLELGCARLAAALTAVALCAGCASRGPAPVAGPRVDRELLPYLLPPSSGFAAPGDDELQRRVDAAYQSKLLAADVAGAEAVAAAVLAANAAFAPADVLRAQARLVAGDVEGARAALAPVIARHPDNAAAQLAAG